MIKEIVRMAEKVAYELRKDEKLAGCVAVKIRYPNFETTCRQMVVKPTGRDDEIIPFVIQLFEKLYRKGNPVRLLGVRLTDFSNNAVQSDLFTDVSRVADLYRAIDGVKDKYGAAYLSKGRTAKKK